MRVTGIGHAGMLVETAGGSILCDPWVNPAFFGSWFPFPDNTWLDWGALGRAEYLYVSHLHRDHFDADNLRRNVRKDAQVLLPDYPTDELEQELRELGFTRFVRTETSVPVQLDGLRIMITSLKGPGDGPIGDSALSVDDGTAVMVDQNDAHPLDIDLLKEFGDYDAHFLQVSGAIWWPMVYDLPAGAKAEFARRKRAGQDERALRYIDEVGAPHVFPIAGPPCFLDEELFRWNALGFGDVAGQSIFTDQWQFLRTLRESGRHGGQLLLPGTVTEIRGREVSVVQPHGDDEIRAMFEEKEAYLRDFQLRAKPALDAAKSTWVAPQPDLLEQLKAWFEPLMARAPRISAGIGGCVRLDVGDRPLVLDFVAGEVRDHAGERCRYTISTAAELVATNIATHEVDWSNSLFLSMRFRASRVGQYNEYVYTFFKCLSIERIDYVENWYDEQDDDGRDVRIGDWWVQHRCPHLHADLSKFGSIDDGVLTCSLHGWRFDLASGRCLTSAGHELRASRVAEAADEPVGAAD